MDEVDIGGLYLPNEKAHNRARAAAKRSGISPSERRHSSMSIEISTSDGPSGTFGVIYADCPWMPGQTGKRGAAEKQGKESARGEHLRPG